MNIPLGAKLDEGTEVVVYEHGADPGLVVKIPHQRPDIDQMLAERIAGEQLLHRAHLSEHVLETRCFVPGIADGCEYPFVEIQTRVPSTLFGSACAALGDGQVQRALRIVGRFFEFEHGVLWASGVVLRDAGSFLKNVAMHRGKIWVLDFSSFSADLRALERLVTCAKAERRIDLMLDKLRPHLPDMIDGPIWDEFCASLWRMSRAHYQLDRMGQAWLARFENRERQDW